MKFKVFITRVLPLLATEQAEQACQVILNQEDRGLTKDELKASVSEADGVISIVADVIDDDVMATAPKLKVISNVAVGYNNIDVDSATRRGILVTNTPGVLTETTADFTWTLLMAAARRVVEGDRYVRAGRFTEWKLTMLLGGDIYGKTLGILGLGRIGKAVARRAQGFEMRILYYDVVRDQAAERELGVVHATKEEILREADFLTLHVQLLPETRHYIGERELRMMKPTAYLINASRGPVVHEAALVRALREKWIAGAGLDVYEEEPKIHPGLMGLENVVLAPHIGSASHETRLKMATMAVENCLSALSGKRPPNLVNPEAWRG